MTAAVNTMAAIDKPADDGITPSAFWQQAGGLSQAVDEERTNADFTGTAAEYFRIWMVNFLLTIITIGIYSPWAKVRNKRYFYGSAWLGGANFEYHANPLTILAARLVLVAVLVGGAYWIGEDNYRDAGYSLILTLVLPWALVRGLAFNARNSSWAGMRLSFKCDFLPIYLIYSPALIINGLLFYVLLAEGLFLDRYSAEVWEIIWFVLAFLTLLFLPLLVRAYHCYKAGRHKLGGLQFRLHNPPVLAYYGAMILPLLVTAGFVFLMTMLVAFVEEKTGIAGVEGKEYFYALIVLFVTGLLSAVVLMQFVPAALFGVFWNHLRARNENFSVRFVCDINIWHFAFKILLVNVVAVIVSLGLLHPWAKVRKTKYLVKHIHIIAPAGAMLSLTSRQGKKESALGEEVDVAEGFDFDVGLI